MTYDDHEDCDTQLNEAEEQILKLKAELKKKDDLLFAYESVKALVNPLLAENKRLRALLEEEVDDGRAIVDDMGFDAWLEQKLKGK